MRRRSIWYWRWDLLLTVLLSAGIAFGAQYLYEQTLEEGYQAYLEKNAAEEGSVGAVASEDIPLAETLADMENNEYFTMEMDSITLNSNSPGGYIDGLFWHIFQLEDGTRIAAKVNSDSVVYREEGEAPMTASYARLPIGTLARESLTDDQLEELKGSLEDLQAEEEEYRDNIPENMQESERYEKADEACDNLSEAVDNLEEVISSIEAAIE